MSTPPSLEFVSIQVEEAVAIIKYNRPDKANALNNGIMRDMLAAMKWAVANSQLKVIVQSGEGRFFTTGMDLDSSRHTSPSNSASENNDNLRELNETLIKCEQVLVAAVNGPAAGYGTSSITLFDLVYAVPDAYFFTPFVRWGLCCEGCSSVTFSRIMGHQKAAALILAGDRMSATDAEKAGLVTKILPKDTFMDDVLAIARRIATYPAGALRFNKNLMMRDVRESLLEANRIECEGLLARGRTDEPKEAIKAFALEQSRKRKGQSLGSRL